MTALFPYESKNFHHQMVTDRGVGFAFFGTDVHPLRSIKPPVMVDGMWESAPTQLEGPTKKYKTTDTERALARAKYRARIEQEDKLMEKQRRRINKRQDIGDPNCRQSEGEDFPLMVVLRRDKLETYIEVVREYRNLVALCESEPLKGLDYRQGMGVEVENESRRLTPEADIDAAAASGWTNVPDGEIQYTSKMKRSKGAYNIPARRKGPAAVNDNGEPSAPKTESLHVKWSDETLIRQIDAKPILEKLRSALGPLRGPFEDAVLGGQTFTQIGVRDGFLVKPDVAGKALVFRAIAAVDGAWDEVDQEAKRQLIASNDNTTATAMAA